MTLITGLLIPFFGTTLGSAIVFFMKQNISIKIEKILLGFTSGIMIAASVWSLIIPSIEMSQSQGNLGWLPASVGFLFGVLFLFFLDSSIQHLNTNSKAKNSKISLGKRTLMIIAITLHNIPEGMAVGVIFAGAISGNTGITMSAAYTLAIGIAIQNFPEGAIISMPLKSEGISKTKAFIYGALSGLVEPISAFITILLTNAITQILPYLLSFAAGSMIFVVVEELIPDSQNGSYSKLGTIGITIGFLLMMILDVSL